MSISISAVLAIAFSVLAVLSFGAGPTLQRRLRRPRDQRSKSSMSPERIRGLAVHRGSRAKTRHAEGYEPVRLLGATLGVS